MSSNSPRLSVTAPDPSNLTPNPFASPPSTPSTRSLSITPIRPSTAPAAAPAPAPTAPTARSPVPSSPRTASFRETFSAPPIRPFHSPQASFSQYSAPSTPPGTRPSTATSSALALTSAAAPNPVHTQVPGLASAVPIPPFLPSSDSVNLVPPKPEKPLRSHLLQGPVQKPWLSQKDPRSRVSYWITLSTSLLGVAAGAAKCYFSYKNVPLITSPLCPVLQDDFDTFSVDSPGATWRREVDLGGFGNGQFDMTTTSSQNSFVKDGYLYIVPTLTADSIPGGNASIFDGYSYNATDCTSATNFEGTGCGAVSNATSGTIINPVQSARLTTQLSHSIQYGKVEIRARNPKGDWLWPALWMLPVNDTYGPWPLSGEIDLMESRGNDFHYSAQGNNVVRSSLNWGPTVALNAVYKTYGWWAERRTDYSAGFHTYTLEWTPDFLRMYVDSRVHRTVDIAFNEPFFTRGHFPPTIQNNSQIVALQNPWIGRGNAAPFDRPFFLIMNVAVGGTNGWFPDNVGNKPWVDGSGTAMRDFALSQDKWYPTWPKNVEERALVVDYVKMWRLC